MTTANVTSYRVLHAAWLTACLTAGLLTACTSDGNLSVEGLAALDDPQSVEVRALPGDDCSAYPVASALETPPLAILRARRGEALVGQLPDRAHVAVALAFDSSCSVVGRACSPATPGNDLTLTMSPVPEFFCEDCRMQDGLCIVGDAPDAGIDSDVLRDSGEGDAEGDTGGDPCFGMCDGPPTEGGDVDEDGIVDQAECPGFVCPCTDTDGDGRPNYCDLDSDGDGFQDDEECNATLGCGDVELDPEARVCMRGTEVIFDSNEVSNCGLCGVACNSSTADRCEVTQGRLRCFFATRLPFRLTGAPAGDEEVSFSLVPLSLDGARVPLPPTDAAGFGAPGTEVYLPKNAAYAAFEIGVGRVTASVPEKIDRRLGVYGVRAEYDGRCAGLPNVLVIIADEASNSVRPLYDIPMHDEISSIETGWGAYRRPTDGAPFEWFNPDRTAFDVSFSALQPCDDVVVSTDDYFGR